MRNVTQADIARSLGVGASTVGLVVGNTYSPLRRRLKKETILRIEKRAREMGYRPNRGAQMLRTGKTNLIVLLNFGGYTEVGGRRAYQIGRLVHEAGFDFQTIDAYWWIGEGQAIVNQILSLRPRGIIISGPLQTELQVEQFIAAGISVVALGSEHPGIPWVRYDARQAVKEMTSRAIAVGRKRLTLVLGSKISSTGWQLRERAGGFQEAITEAGGAAPKSHSSDYEFSRSVAALQSQVVHSLTRPLPFQDFEPGMEAADRILNLRVRPDTFICTNDKYAIGALTICSRLGVSVPDDLWVTGFDNLAYGTQGAVSLTSVAQQTALLCQAVMEMLQERLERAASLESAPEERVIPCKVIWRESTSSPELSPSLPTTNHTTANTQLL